MTPPNTAPEPATTPIVLASSSPYRRQLLERLGIPFSVASPDVDETPRTGEAPDAQVRRLAETKARAVAAAHRAALVIGSDQLAAMEGVVFGKPGDHAGATQQLRRMRGRAVTFYTGLCLHHSGSGATVTDCVPFVVSFREYSDAEIERYLAREQPYGCAGSFMSEGLGIGLVKSLRGDDPSALIGLPLIRLGEMLRAAGVSIP